MNIVWTEDESWLLRIEDADSKIKYPKEIKVGELDNPVLYVPERYANERTCKLVGESSYYCYAHTHHKYKKCSICGHSIEAELVDEWTNKEHYEWDNYCRNCGAKVVDE